MERSRSVASARGRERTPLAHGPTFHNGWRYIVATVPITLAGQVLLYLLHAGLGVRGTWANVVAFSVLVGPQYVLNRRWVWAERKRTDHVYREAVLFWVIGGAGLLMSTAAVAVAEHLFHPPLWVNAASLGGFGAVWVAKFFILDRLLFAGSTAPWGPR